VPDFKNDDRPSPAFAYYTNSTAVLSCFSLQTVTEKLSPLNKLLFISKIERRDGRNGRMGANEEPFVFEDDPRRKIDSSE
jgi:hypothetical protein